MLEETRYIESVWNRYNAYCNGTYQNDFYETRVYRQEKDFSRVLKMAAMIILCITTSLGAVYAGIAIYNNYIKNAIFIEGSEERIPKKWIYENMSIIEGDIFMYYKDITSYEEYQKYKNKFKTEDIPETDFENNFVIILCGETINIENIATDENTISINYKSEYEKEKNVQTILLPKEQYRENIKLAKVQENTQSNNIAIQDITTEYTKEQAIADGCIVVENRNIISNNENAIYEFLEKSKNGEESFIRIVQYYSNKQSKIEDPIIEIREIECKDKMNVLSYRKIYKDREETKNDLRFNHIEIKQRVDYKSLVLYDGEAQTFVVIKF